jgi:glycosyltransferase involved in cell wall biosynthesis
MRVGFDARWYNQSGVGTYVGELLRALAELPSGVELVVYQDAANPAPAFDGEGIERVALRSGKYSLPSQWQLAERAKRDRLDVFHSPFYAAPMFLPCPLIVTLHDLIPFLFPIAPWPKQLAVRAGYRMAARRAAHFICVSESTARDAQRILQIPSSRMTTIYEAAAAEFHPRAPAEELDELKKRFGIRPPFVVAASARNWRTKNLVAALRALSAARQATGIAFQTVIYGASGAANRSKDGLQAAGGISAWPDLSIIATGHVAASELAAFFRQAEFFIAPSLYEGFGLPLAEAMACGCAVIASNRDSLPEVAGQGAQLFDPGDIDGMARAASELLRDPASLQSWRRRAAGRAQFFSWKKAAEETLMVYHQVGQRRAVAQAG